MRLPVGIVFAVLRRAPAFGDESPVAPQPGAPSGEADRESLGDTMQLIQLKHVELWQAGVASHWRPVAFETGEIRDTFHKAAMVYTNIPVADVLAVEPPLAATSRAIKTRDSVGFDAAYGGLTAARNGCHRAADVDFIVIQTPNAKSPADQKL